MVKDGVDFDVSLVAAVVATEDRRACTFSVGAQPWADGQGSRFAGQFAQRGSNTPGTLRDPPQPSRSPVSDRGFGCGFLRLCPSPCLCPSRSFFRASGAESAWPSQDLCVAEGSVDDDTVLDTVSGDGDALVDPDAFSGGTLVDDAIMTDAFSGGTLVDPDAFSGGRTLVIIPDAGSGVTFVDDVTIPDAISGGTFVDDATIPDAVSGGTLVDDAVVPDAVSGGTLVDDAVEDWARLFTR